MDVESIKAARWYGTLRELTYDNAALITSVLLGYYIRVSSLSYSLRLYCGLFQYGTGTAHYRVPHFSLFSKTEPKLDFRLTLGGIEIVVVHAPFWHPSFVCHAVRHKYNKQVRLAFYPSFIHLCSLWLMNCAVFSKGEERSPISLLCKPD